MITALQLKNSPAKLANLPPLGMGATVTLYAEGFADVELAVETLNLRRGGSNYCVINVPTDYETAGLLLAMAVGARIRLNLLLFTENGGRYVSSNFDLDLYDLRYDQGITATTVVLVSRSLINIPASSPVVAPAYQAKQKRSIPNIIYTYTVNAFDYRNYSIGTAWTDGDMTGNITSSYLAIGAKSPPLLTIEVTPNT